MGVYYRVCGDAPMEADPFDAAAIIIITQFMRGCRLWISFHTDDVDVAPRIGNALILYRLGMVAVARGIQV